MRRKGRRRAQDREARVFAVGVAFRESPATAARRSIKVELKGVAAARSLKGSISAAVGGDQVAVCGGRTGESVQLQLCSGHSGRADDGLFSLPRRRRELRAGAGDRSDQLRRALFIYGDQGIRASVRIPAGTNV